MNYEYQWVAARPLDEMQQAGREGWRVVPGVLLERPAGALFAGEQHVLMERQLRPEPRPMPEPAEEAPVERFNWRLLSRLVPPRPRRR